MDVKELLGAYKDELLATEQYETQADPSVSTG
jgi:hypothetical protein